MLFLNPWLLAGLAGVAIPIIIHLVRRQAAKPIDWGAMRFLFDTVAMRKRKIEWEDLLLMAARCLLLGLAALALARPFVPPDSSVPWLFVLPGALVGIALLGGSFVLAGKARWIVRLSALVLLLAAAGLILLERSLNLKRFEAGGRRDVALVIDASASMELSLDGKTVFRRAVEEAKQLVKEAPRGTAFLVVLGGPAPEAKTASPLTHRADVLGVLDSLRPVGGNFRAHEALGVATLGLAEGTNASKEIVVFTDAQRGGWRFDNPNAWDGLEEAWKALPAKPKLLLRDFGVPASLRNVALSGIELSRRVVGTDRELTLRVSVENTGTEAVTPGPVALEIGGVKSGEKPVGLLVAGQKETVEFRHRFTQAGPQVIAARMDARDDLAADDKAERVVTVRGTLPVLLVDGNPAGSFFERAAGYSALALAPSSDLRRGKDDGKDDGKDHLMDPEVVAAPELGEEDFEDRAVIILADVPRLPERLARQLAARIADGAGLLVIAGPRTDPAFFNQWKGSDGPVLPMPLGEIAVDLEGVSPAPATFLHESVSLFKDDKNSDLASALVKQWRKTGEPAPGAVQAAAYRNGETFLAARNYGNGRSLLATCAFDARSGNLPALRAFVPLLHELVAWTAGSGVALNVESAWSPAVAFHGSGGGLAGSEFRDKGSKGRPTIVRNDAEGEVAGKPMKVMDPLGLPREAMLRPVRKGRELAINGPAVPGIYQVTPGEDLRTLLGMKEGQSLPVAVLRDPAESRFEARTEEDLAMVRGHVDLLQPSSVGDLLGVLQGKGFGREIWKLLAIAAFVLFLLESALARWVSRNRRAGDETRIDFGQDAVWATRK